ncbi:DUF2834 domain-containing protein [Rhodococcus sp. NPDC127530]|uniref:DUF2834 domain-containing protein n=1 Tax=unclassified Rhodococcus (in: high G+C Gram-positive bacteria) TaxID=192944 RepID=UPI0036407E6B
MAYFADGVALWEYLPARHANYASSSFTNDLTLLTLAAVVFMVRRSPQTRYQHV